MSPTYKKVKMSLFQIHISAQTTPGRVQTINTAPINLSHASIFSSLSPSSLALLIWCKMAPVSFAHASIISRLASMVLRLDQLRFPGQTGLIHLHVRALQEQAIRGQHFTDNDLKDISNDHSPDGDLDTFTTANDGDDFIGHLRIEFPEFLVLGLIRTSLSVKKH
jgi:hypothetical protein